MVPLQLNSSHHCESLLSQPWLGWLLWNTCVTNDHGYVPLVVNTSPSYPNSWLITRFVTRVTRRKPLVQQELFTLPEHLRSPSVLSGVRFARSLVLRVFFWDRCFTFLFLLAFVLFILLRYTDFYCLPLVSSNSSYVVCLWLCILCCAFVLFFLVLCVSVASFSVLSSLIDPSIFSDVYILPEDNVVEDSVVIDLRILTTHLVSSKSSQWNNYHVTFTWCVCGKEAVLLLLLSFKLECVYGEKGATSSSKDLMLSSNFEIMSKIEERHNQKKIKQQRSTKNYTED